jgi:prolyl oligopeptidase
MTKGDGREFGAPPARAEVVRDTYFGVTVEDPYRWLEDTGSDEVSAWLGAQARYSRSVLDALPHRAGFRAQIAGLPSGTPPLSQIRIVRRAVFFLRQDAGSDVAALVARDRSAGSERVLLDPAGIRDVGHSTIDWFVPSPDGRSVVCGVSQGGAERSTIHVVDVGSGEAVEAAVDGIAFSFLSWLADDDGEFRSFVYHRYRDVPDGTRPNEARLNSRSLLHRIGDDPQRDEVVLARDLNPHLPLSEHDRPFLAMSPNGGWSLVLVSHSALGETTTEYLTDCTLYVARSGKLADPISCPWQRVAEVEDDVVAYALSEDTLYLVTGRDAPRYQVVAVPLTDNGPQQPRLLVPESERVIEAVIIAGDYLLVRDLERGLGRLRRVPLEGGEVEDVALPVEGSIWEWVADPEQAEVLLRVSSWTVPPRVYRCDVRSGAVEDTGWMPPPSIDLSGIEAHELQVLARDGTPIPLSIIHRKALRRDGDNPTLLTAYGSYGHPFRPSFEPELLPWYERGGVFAVAHVRGGGEHGRDWHEAGRGVRKETTITDFIDCAEYLIARGYTRPERLAAEGESAGGITVGGAMVRRPDLWAAIVLRVPVTNALRNEFGANGPINVPEFGSLTTEDGLKGLLIMDCYHRVQDKTPYPAVLLTGGMNDPRVDVWQPAKVAARLQAATTSGRPVLLRIDEQAGHGIGSTRSQRDEELADELAFLLDHLGTATG